MDRRPGLVVLALSLLSLAGFARWQGVEESLATLWLPAFRVTDALSPERVVEAEALPAADVVAAVSEAWRAELRRRPAAPVGRELLSVPVLSVDLARRELVIAVPPDSVLLDAPVTHHGRYVGSLCSWRAGDRVVERDGRARVALPGHARARPVAGVWSASETGLPLHFLVQSEAGVAAVTQPSRRLVAAQDQAVYTRDVRALGDDLPAGLLLGSLQLVPRDRPGGGFDLQRNELANLKPAIRPEHLGTVVIEVTRGARLPSAAREAECLGSPRADGTQLRIDRGRVAGLQRGDWVVSGSQLLGVVHALGPFSARVERRAPPGLLVIEDGARLIPTAPQVDGWPAVWRPVVGQRVWAGHRELGALFLGRVARVHELGFEIDFAELPGTHDVLVVEP
ncbi:MAG: hypothetical protein DHS20C15_07210 [Planctomycetota bacterium]|nr:MAG: hypothetical protein DHS20C15_07210 [Planctomycetota bacterium]